MGPIFTSTLSATFPRNITSVEAFKDEYGNIYDRNGCIIHSATTNYTPYEDTTPNKKSNRTEVDLCLCSKEIWEK